MTGRVFRRSLDPELPVAVEAHGSTIRDATGREYLDAAGGAIVVNVGHGRASIARVLGGAGRAACRMPTAPRSRRSRSRRTRRRSARASRSTTPRSTRSAAGREAIETALKMARAYHLARGEAERWIVIARWG